MALKVMVCIVLQSQERLMGMLLTSMPFSPLVLFRTYTGTFPIHTKTLEKSKFTKGLPQG